jgi:carbon-monoxide dehydrogenase small subunit
VKKKLELKVNEEMWDIEVDPHRTLLEVLRELIDGAPVLSCLTLAVEVENKAIRTIEGLMKDNQPDPLQLAFVDHGAIQCGFCTPGSIMTATALLEKNPRPSREEIKEALSGNLCRCTGYKKIIEAVESVAGD